MSKRIETISAGLEGLLSTNQTAAAVEQAAQEPKPKYKTVCYSISPDLADRIKEIAFWDRKKVNAVVTEAFRAYCDTWKPATKDKPAKF